MGMPLACDETDDQESVICRQKYREMKGQIKKHILTLILQDLNKEEARRVKLW